MTIDDTTWRDLADMAVSVSRYVRAARNGPLRGVSPMTIDNDHLHDVGPATPPPTWCAPDTEPSWDTLTDEHGGGMVCSWTRNFPDADDADVWIVAEDRVVGGRVMRSAPRIQVAEMTAAGIDAPQARRLAAELLNAADVLEAL